MAAEVCDTEALVRQSIGLVYSIARSFCATSRTDYEEAVADGMVGLVKAAQRFDPAENFQFSTYATQVILGEMKEGVRRFHKISRGAGEATRGKPRSRVVSLLNDTWARSIYADRDNRNSNADILELPDPEPLPLERLCTEENKRQLASAIKTCLDDRQRYLIEQHYFHGTTLIRIAAALGVGQDRVWQLHQAALGKLRLHQARQ